MIKLHRVYTKKFYVKDIFFLITEPLEEGLIFLALGEVILNNPSQMFSSVVHKKR